MEKTINNISPISFAGYFISMLICGLVSAGGFSIGRTMIMVSQYTYRPQPPVMGMVISCIGAVGLMLSIYLFYLFIRELIADANVRALEVFYGKPREIKAITKAYKGKQKTLPQKSGATKRGWQLSDDKD